jgi:hypothetical protein
MTQPTKALFGKNRGAPAWRWGAPGDSAQGVITALSATQQRDMRTKELKYFPSGDPIMIALVTVQTGLHDPTLPADNGERTIWVSGRYMTKAVKDAIMRAGTGNWRSAAGSKSRTRMTARRSGGSARRACSQPNTFRPPPRNGPPRKLPPKPPVTRGQPSGRGRAPAPRGPCQPGTGQLRGRAGPCWRVRPVGGRPGNDPPSPPTMSASTGPVDKINSPAGSGTPERSGSPAGAAQGPHSPLPCQGPPPGAALTCRR